MSNISSTVTIIKKLQDEIAAKYPSYKQVYDPALAYDSATKLLRGQNSIKKLIDKENPLFAFNRSVLRYHPNLGSRGTTTAIVKDLDLTTGLEYKAAVGEFDFRFAFASPNFQVIEEFEMDYITKMGINSIKVLDVEIPGLQKFPYVLQWHDFEDVVVEYENYFAKTLTASVTIQGIFIVIKGETNLIREIYGTYYDWYETILTEFVVQ